MKDIVVRTVMHDAGIKDNPVLVEKIMSATINVFLIGVGPELLSAAASPNREARALAAAVAAAARMLR